VGRAGRCSPVLKQRSPSSHQLGLLLGSPRKTRTFNLPVNSRLLCQLSYRGPLSVPTSRWVTGGLVVTQPVRTCSDLLFRCTHALKAKNLPVIRAEVFVVPRWYAIYPLSWPYAHVVAVVGVRRWASCGVVSDGLVRGADVGRPSLAIGTGGNITCVRVGGSWRARCRFRDYDGVTRLVERFGPSKTAAERKLKEALRDRVRIDAEAEINPDTKLAVVAEAWWAVFSVADGSPGTKRIYRDRLDNQIVPALGNIRCRELTVGTVERFLRAVEDRHGPSLTKTVRSVLSNTCAFAARHDGMVRNPVRETSPISVKPKRGKAKALDITQLRQLSAFITYDDQAIDRDLPDLMDFLAATGVRIGEALAIVRDACDLETGTVEIRGTVIRIKGVGVVIKPEPKTEAGYRTLVLPSWAIAILGRRFDDDWVKGGELELLFPSNRGTLRDPSNVDHQIKDAFTFAGLSELTSHIFRRSVATLMDKAGLSARAGADQLGHSNPSMTMNSYWGRKVADTGAAAVLEALAA
jgi:integrase